MTHKVRVCRLYGKQQDVNTLCYSSGPRLYTNASTVTCITPAISLTLVYIELNGSLLEKYLTRR